MRPSRAASPSARGGSAAGRRGLPVDRDEAEKALAIIRQVVQDTRDDLIERNWGLIWMIHAFTNLAAFLTLGLAIEPRGLPISWYLVPLAIVAGVDLAIVLVLVRRQ